MIVGPTLRAAFYRKSALEALAGLEQCGGNLWADVDLALSLQALGFSCVLEPRCTVRGRFAEDSVTAFEHGRCAESVFWKHAGLNGWAPSLLCHPLVVLGSLIFPWNGPPGGRQLLGRLAALARLFGHLSNAARLRQTANFFRRGPSGVRRAPSGHGAEDGAGPPRLSVCRHQRAA
jgi:hypothetical protein